MKNEIIKKLSNEYSRARSKNPSYSLRAFAKRIGVPPSALSEILNGKRPISKNMGQRILTGLGVNPVEMEEIITGAKNSYESELSLDYFKVISDWYYFAILSLAEIPSFQANPDWISERLNITKRNAKAAIDLLIKLELLVKDSDGNYIASGVQYKTPTDVLNASLKTHTIQTLELAKESILNDAVEKRDFSTITMAIDPQNIGIAKKMIKSFRKRLSAKLELGNKKEVYKLAIQLFPLSKFKEATGEKNV